MEHFKTYLKTRFHYTDQSLKLKTDHVKQYQNHCSEQQELYKLNFKELLKIIEIQRKKYSITTINNQLHSLETYFYYQIEIGNRKDNPIENFRVKAEKPKLLQGFLNTEELDFIYENYPTEQKNRNKIYLLRNKIILGLMVYQGLSTGTIENLKTTDINLEKAQINVPKTSERKHNPRILPLESVQIVQLHNYLNQHKKELERQLNINENDILLIPKREKARMKDITKMIKNDVQKYFEIKDIYQFRISRITIWMKNYKAREVQYKSGYKHLLRLEQYRENELESLKQAVEKYHTF